MTTITIKTREGDHEVDVIERRGVWVLHEHTWSPDVYTVTRAPSGLAAAHGPRHEAEAVLMALADHAPDFTEDADQCERGRVCDLIAAAMTRARHAHRETRMSALLREASPEPWVAHTADTAGEGWLVCSMGNSGLDGEDWGVEVRGVPCSMMAGDARTDALLIAAMRSRVPVLIERLESLADRMEDTPLAGELRDALRLFEEGEG